ncbi:MAG: hypothetical protein ACK5E6_09755, partial [Cyanobacteriota bacterium]
MVVAANENVVKRTADQIFDGSGEVGERLTVVPVLGSCRTNRTPLLAWAKDRVSSLTTAPGINGRVERRSAEPARPPAELGTV